MVQTADPGAGRLRSGGFRTAQVRCGRSPAGVGGALRADRPVTDPARLGYRRAVTQPRDPALPTPDVGRLVAGRYRLEQVIGTGGMATVHRALDTRLDRPVAVKLLRREVVADADLAMRFRREALAATVLRHPNLIACLETGTDDGQPFLVMELIDGEDLAARLKRVGRLAPSEAARIGLDVARALGVAHVRGIVHRDVKPGNILLARDGRSMITDFGIARLSADTEGAVPGTTLGSVHYFSPEQAKGETTTAASDVYSLGLVLYESLTGQRAWRGDTTASLATARIDAPAPSPRAIRPELPAILDAVVVRALDPDPARRYPNGNALAAALEPIVAYPDPKSPTVAVDTAELVAGAEAAAAAAAASISGGGPPLPPPSAMVAPASGPPLRPEPAPVAARPSRTAVVRDAPPQIAAPMALLFVVVAVVGGALLVAAMSGRGDAGGLALASPSPHATAAQTATPTPRPTPAPTPTPKPTAAPKPTPVPPPNSPSRGARDLCDPFLGIGCGLDGGTYEPTKFRPPIHFVLGDGWSVSASDPDRFVLDRTEGSMTFASGVTVVYPNGTASQAPRSARSLVETFIETDGVAAGKPADGHVAKRKSTVVDLTPTGSGRVALFGTDSQTFYLEPVGTTRVTVVDGPTGPIVIATQPAENSTIQAIRKIADPVIKSLAFR
jgi:serine/threonine-protein kinase